MSSESELSMRPRNEVLGNFYNHFYRECDQDISPYAGYIESVKDRRGKD